MTQLRVWRRTEATHERVLLGPEPTQGFGEGASPGAAGAAAGAAGAAGAPGVPNALRAQASAAELRAQVEQQQTRIGALTDSLTAATQDAEGLRAKLALLQKGLQEAHQQAQERGYHAGQLAAQSESQQQLQQMLAAWQSSAEEMLRLNDARLQSTRAEVGEVVLAAVAKILGDQLANPQMVRASVEHLLKESGVHPPLRVLLAPAQHEQLMKSGGAQLAWFRDHRLEVAADTRVQHGGCMLESATGIVDGRFEVQLEKLREIVAGHYGAAAR